jgi:membrane protein implicated in regulation of membrane protease activity
MTSFFRMDKTERWFLVALVALSAVSFLPLWRSVYMAGMSLLGWWMVALMVLSPLGALVIFFLERWRSRQRSDTR